MIAELFKPDHQYKGHTTLFCFLLFLNFSLLTFPYLPGFENLAGHSIPKLPV